ncbi:MAG: FlgD immunoglobulin-like domain containing protein [Gaiellaceae bacterium]
MRRPPRLALLALTIGIGLTSPKIVSAQTGGPYSLTWSSIAGGGAMFSTAASPAYSLGGTIGQTSPGPLSGGAFSLLGGFWSRGFGAIADVPDSPTDIPAAFRIYPNVPNPFNQTTTVAFDLPSEQRVTMEVFSLRGERVRVLLDEVMPAGRHSMTWAGIRDDGRPMEPGVYWIRTLANNQRDVRKAVLVK